MRLRVRGYEILVFWRKLSVRSKWMTPENIKVVQLSRNGGLIVI